MRIFDRHPIYYVRWLDHHSDDNWAKPSIENSGYNESVGFLVGKGQDPKTNEHYIQIAHSYAGVESGDQFGGTYTIWEPLIVDKWELTVE